MAHDREAEQADPDNGEPATADDGPRTDDEKVEEASEDSYPASDPPAW